MRKRNSINLRRQSAQFSTLVFVALVFGATLTTGCSKLKIPGIQDYGSTGFDAIPQPKSLAESSTESQRSIEQILADQESVRKDRAKEESQEASESKVADNAEAAKAGKTTAENESTSGVVQAGLDGDADKKTASAKSSEFVQQQKKEIVEEAGFRAGNLLRPSNVSPTSFVTDVAKADEDRAKSSSGTGDTEAVTKSAADVTLFAQVDNFENVPQNLARDSRELAVTNMLRPVGENADRIEEAASEAKVADAESAVQMEKPNFTLQSFGAPTALTGPLKPMLFDPSTREANSSYQGTLRPIRSVSQEIETDVVVEKQAETDVLASTADADRSLVANKVIKLEQSELPQTAFRAPSDSLPMGTFDASGEVQKSASAFKPFNEPAAPVAAAPAPVSEVPPSFKAPLPEVEPKTEIVEAVSEPQYYAAQIIEVDPPVKVVENAEESSLVMPATETIDDGVPVVDSSLAAATARYLQTQPTNQQVIPALATAPESFIPAEVFEDAAAVAKDVEREMTADAIPHSTSGNNEFKVQAVSSTSVESVCRSCGVRSCEGCELKQGEPLMANNDFAAPSDPSPAKSYGNEAKGFVSPMEIPSMTIPPVSVPMAERVGSSELKANHHFGMPAALQPPPETPGPVHRVAALPVVASGSDSTTEFSSVPPVGVSTLMDLNAVTWKSRLDQAIVLAEEKLNVEDPRSAAATVNLRLLKAVRSQMEQVEDEKLTQQELNYWEHQLQAITSMLQVSKDGSAATDFHRHQSAHETLQHLRDAVEQLESIANLKITSGQFCTDISGFGQFRTFPSTTFTPQQRMLIYCEVENYRAVEQESTTGTSFRTRLRGSFAIYDANGKVVQQAEFPAVEDVARKRRRDFYMYLPVTIGDLPAGNYVMHVLVEDLHGNKSAALDPPMNFSIESAK
jgi:hypothetical protein